MQIWKALKPYDFKATYGVMAKISNVCKSPLVAQIFFLSAKFSVLMPAIHAVEKPGHSLSLKGRVLQSAKIAVKAMGYADHGIFAEEL